MKFETKESKKLTKLLEDDESDLFVDAGLVGVSIHVDDDDEEGGRRCRN